MLFMPFMPQSPNLSLISKIIEPVAESRLTEHLSSINILKPHQSAYHKHHSTETALLYIHDHLISAISQLTNLCKTLTPPISGIHRIYMWVRSVSICYRP